MTDYVQNPKHERIKFFLVGEEDYTTMRGKQIKLKVWESVCLKCENKFTVKTPQDISKTGAFYQVHCKEHKGKSIWAR